MKYFVFYNGKKIEMCFVVAFSRSNFFGEKQKHDYFSFYLFKFLWVFSFN